MYVHMHACMHVTSHSPLYIGVRCGQEAALHSVDMRSGKCSRKRSEKRSGKRSLPLKLLQKRSQERSEKRLQERS